LARARHGVSRRRSAFREPYDRVLIVTEGERTEPLYFGELVTRYRLNTANVRIVPSTMGSDPVSVVTAALEIRDAEVRQGEQYDQVYCVFDRDSHANFDAATQKAVREGIRIARSWPCFEYWLLLHYEFVRRPFVQTQSGSACDNCIAMLRRHISGYRKATPGLFGRLEERVDQATAAARQALADVQTTGAENPSTEVHLLVGYLRQIKG